jgi:23S rRNA (uracil1939-C5)-methyltransferase
LVSTKISITGLGHEGEGVGRVDGIATFIPGALPGETVLVNIKEKKKSFQRGSLEEILEPSPERIAAPCQVYEECGGCQLQHLDYNASLVWKKQRVEDALERIGKLSGVTVKPVLGMQEQWRYRNKVQLQAGEINGKLELGYYSKKSNRLVPFTDCLLISPLFNSIRAYLVNFFNENRITKANLEQVIIRYSPQTMEVMLGLVGTLPKLPWESVKKEFSQIKSIVAVNPKSRGVQVLLGAGTIRDQVFGNQFTLSLQSFSQVNPTQTEVLYAKTLEYAGLTGTEAVVDAYCGIGTITLALARRAKSAIGIEVVAQAVRDARENAKLNNINNVEFYAAPTEKILPELAEKGLKADVVVLDPPRSGCEKVALEAIVSINPKRIVYVSCDPATLARDLGFLQERGYRTLEVQPVDMFPWTAHVETVVLLKRKHS